MLSKEQIIAALSALDRQLGERGAHGEVCLVGGAVMCLVYEARPATRDVDAWFMPTTDIRAAAVAVAEDLGLPPDWLNDAAEGYLSGQATFVSWLSLPNLEIRVADAQTMLAMKCLAARSEQDGADIRSLVSALGLKASAAVLDVVARFYDPQQIHIRTQLLLEEMFDAEGG